MKQTLKRLTTLIFCSVMMSFSFSKANAGAFNSDNKSAKTIDKILSSPPPPLVLSSTAAGAVVCGSNITVSITAVSGFSNIGTLQYSVSWDASKFQYVSSAPLVINGDSPLVNNGPGNFTYSWSDVSGAYGSTVANGTVLATITLKALASSGTHMVDITATPAVIEATDNNFDEVTVNTQNLTSIGFSGPVQNTNTLDTYCTLQAAIDAASSGHTIKLLQNISEGLVTINKAININGDGKTLTSSSSISYGINVSSPNVSITGLTVFDATTFGIQVDCGSDNFALTNSTVNSCGGTGIGLNGSDNAVLTNITSTNNGGNGISITNCDNTTINGITTSGNAFGTGFSAGIGLFTSNIYCLPAGINGFNLTGSINISEPAKVYSQKASAAHVITGITGSTIQWAVGTGATDRSYWPSKAVAYGVVDGLFEAPYNLPNSVVYVAEVATDNFYVEDDPNGDPTPPMSIQTAINFLTTGKTVFVEEGSYNERLNINKSLTVDGDNILTTVLFGSGLPTGNSGITINAGITNVTIRDLGITAFTGSTPNTSGGVFASGGNNNLTLMNLDISNNVNCSGIYIAAVGGINNVMIDGVKSHGHGAPGNPARGIVIWDGLKSNVTIQNCEVYLNNCCGIELQDGSATGVTLANNNVHDNSDSGMSTIGLTGPGSTIINNNTVTNNGRFGIEIKVPNGSGATSGPGSIVLQNNIVSRSTTIIPENRDIAGIAVYRRAFSSANNNVNIPTGVVLQNNTVTGFSQPSTSDGFGIVIEGTNHKVTGNTVSGNNVGIQQQAGHLPYAENTSTDGDQSNLPDLYFGRGNTPVACGNVISGNTLTNTVNVRNVGAAVNTLAGVVKNTNNGETFCSIQSANDDSNTANGHTIAVNAGTFVENITITKQLTLNGAQAGVNPLTTGIVARPGGESIITPPSINTTDGTSLSVGVNNVTVDGFTFNGNNPGLSGGISINGTDIHNARAISNLQPASPVSNLTVKNNIIQNLYRQGLYLFTPTFAVQQNNLVEKNVFDNLHRLTADGTATAVYMENESTLSVKNNKMLRVGRGIFTATMGAVVNLPFEFSNNDISSYFTGIWVNNHHTTAPVCTIEGNTLRTETGALTNRGMQITSMSVPNSIIVNNNSITTSAQDGMRIWNTAAEVTVSNTTITNPLRYGVLVVNNFSPFGDASTDTKIKLSNVDVIGGQYGVNAVDTTAAAKPIVVRITDDCDFVNATSTAIRLKGTDVSGLVFDNDASIHGNPIGIDVDGASATITNNHIYNNGIGVRFTNAGTGTVNNLNNFDGGADPDNGRDIQSTASAGMVIATPNNSFAGDVYGVENLSATNIDASYSYWEAASGPGPVAPNGTGSNITTKVLFCPWLNAAPPGGMPVGPVKNTTTLETFCTIQAAIDDADIGPGHVLEVAPGNYNEQVLVNKEVKIIGVGAIKPVVNFTGTLTGKPTLFDVTANNVTIENMQLDVDLSKLRSAVIASDATLDNIVVKDNMIGAYGTPAGSYGDRNAVSVNYGGPTNYRVATGGVNTVVFTGNMVTGTGPASYFRSGIALDEGGLTATGNTLTTINHDVLLRFASNGVNTISGNTFNGGGVELSDQNAGSGTITLSGNTFTGAGAPGTAMLRVKNNYNSIPHSITSNTFTGFEWAVSLENMNSVLLDANTFTASSATARAVVVNTKSISSNSNTIVQIPVAAKMTNNAFNGTGTALTFQNHDSDNDTYGTFTIGAAGNANTFASTLSNFIQLDAQTGSSNGSTFPVYPVTGGWPTTMDCWATNLDVQNNTYDVGAGLQMASAMNAAQRTVLEGKLIHKPDVACLGVLTYFLPVHNLTQNTYYLTIQEAINVAVANDVLELSEWTFNEAVVVDKSLTLQGLDMDKTKQVITGTGLGIASGITINNGVTGVTIKNLTVQNFTGASGNANAGIYGIGGNDNLTVTNVAMMNNPTASGFYANGPVNNVSITNSMAVNNGSGARGIVIWNGLKTNITIAGNMVSNNSCCGIELQDGNASAVNVSKNTIDIGGGDNAIGIVGLNSIVGANKVDSNIITGGGRFGIEIKNPAGGVSVKGNTVNLTTQNSDVRDRAGIAIFRRGVTAGNVDVANGVTVIGNTVSGYQQSSTSEGFGIVVEGTNHTVNGNTVSGCDVGILQQQNSSNYPGDANQADVADLYFGRGNSPMTCGNTISGNTFSSNGADTRDIGVGAGIVTNTNTTEIFCSIQSAINDPQTLNGHTLTVQPGTYNEQVIVNKELTIKSATATKAIVNFTGTPTGKPTLFDVTANNVTIENMQLDVDLSKLRSAVIASDATLDNIVVKDNMIGAYGTPAGSYGDRNAVSVNYGGPTNYRVATGGVNTVVFTGNMVTGTGPASYFRSGISLDEGGLTATGNTIASINHDVLLRFASNGANTISGNTFNGGGVELSDQNAGSGTITLSGNTFTGAGAPGTAMLRVKNNYFSVPHTISTNTFTGFEWAVSLENMNAVTLDANTFTASSATARAVVVNTKSISSNSNTIVQVPVAAKLTNNAFNGTGTALTFQNHDSDNDTYGTFTIGTAGNANTFASTLSNFIQLDAQTGSSNGSTFPVYPTSGTWPTIMDCWATNLDVQNNTYDVGAGLQMASAMNAAQRTVLEGKLMHKPDVACLGLLTYYLPVHNLTQNTYHLTIQEGINLSMANDVLELAEWTFNESATIDKTLSIQGLTTDKTKHVMTGTGLGVTSGIKINNGVTGVTIKNLTVQNFTGASGNANAGIYGIGGNDNLTVTNVAMMNNPTASGFYANGPVNNVSITNSMAVNNGSGARGIVIWNGLKTNITITGNMVSNNSCCGIELQDGNASAVNVSKNTIDIGGGDNAIGIVGLNSIVGANKVDSNIITGGGRFGIEIKNPSGGVTVKGNTVNLATQNSDVRDRAGIAIFRRGVTAGNVDVPNGVTIIGNTVSGYQQSSTSEGFGIVVEGTNHTVNGNTVSGCDVGILQQQNSSNYPGDANQADVADLYFGRGNSPMTCGNTISGNTFSSNGADTRDIGVGAGIVTNTNTTEIFCSIQSAINDPQTLNGHTLTVQPGTYNEQVIVNKELTIKSATATKAIVNFTGTLTGKPTLFDVTANNVTIENMQLDVDLSKLRSAVIASDATLDNIAVKDNMIGAYGTPAGNYGDRNAVSVNYGGPTNYRVATGGVNTVVFTGNMVTGTGPASYFRSGIALDEGGLTATGNTLTTINHDVLLRFASNGANTISGNTFNGGGVELSDQNAGSGTITLSGNTFTGAGAPGTAMLRVKNNYNSIPHSITSNTFTGFEWAVSLENMNSVLLDANTFTPSSATARAVVVNTKSISSNSNTIAQVPVAAKMTNNAFNGTGTALTFQNHDSDNDGYGTFTIGAAGNVNTFASTLSNFIQLDAQTGSSNGSTFPIYPVTGGWPTTMDCWDTNLDVQNNTYDVGAGLQMPSAMSVPQRLALEGKMIHKPDVSCLGILRYYFPIHNVTQDIYHYSIQEAINASTTLAGDVIAAPAGKYAENIVVSKPLTLQGPNEAVDACSGMRTEEAILTTAVSDIAGTGAYSIVDIQASNVTIKGFTIDGDNTNIVTGYSSTTGADIDIATGVTRYVTGTNTVVTNNIIKNVSYFGVELYDFAAAIPSAGNIVSNNKIQDLGTYDAGSGIDYWGGGVLIYNNQYTEIKNNCMTNVRLGIQTGNFHLANPAAASYQTISNNTIQSRRMGVFHNLHYGSASPLAFSTNSFTTTDNSNETTWRGFTLGSLSVASSLVNNTISGAGSARTNVEGINVWNCQIAPNISGGTISNVKLGVNVNNYEGYNSNANNTLATIDGVTITGATIAGIKVHDNPANTNGATVLAEIKGNTTVSGSPIGTWVLNADASANVHDNLASINANAEGILVDGGTATIEKNHIYDNGIGIRFTNGGSGIVRTNKFKGTTSNGKDIQATTTAGLVTATPNNWFAGTTFGVENLSATSIDAKDNFWDATRGPGMVGPGSGANISTNVIYCPWLDAAPTAFGGAGTIAPSPTAVILVAETSAALDNDAIICNGSSVTLNATTPGATAYLWSGSQTASSITVSPGTTTTYAVTVSFGGCTDDDDQVITVNPILTPTFNTVGPICSGDMMSALPTTSNNGVTGSWSPALNNLATTTYTFTPAARECAIPTTMAITVNPIVISTFTQVAPICAGTTLSPLPTMSNEGITGSWAPALNNMATTTYTFTPNAPGQCGTTATMQIVVQPQPNAGTNGTLTICAGTTVTAPQLFAQLGGSPETGGVWTPTLAGAGIYTYIVLATAPCTGIATATVTVTAQPQPNAGTNGTLIICAGSTVTASQLFASLGGAPNAGGIWTPALGGAGVYTYTVNAISPCTGSATATVTVAEQAQPNAGTNGTLTICDGNTVTAPQLFAQLGGTPNAGGTWTPTLAGAGVYTYIVIASPPCTGIATATVTVTALPIAMTTLNESVCAIDLPYIWNSQTINSSGTYTHTETGANGCDSITTLNLIVNPQPVALLNFTTVQNICKSSPITLDASPSMASSPAYRWFKDETFISDSFRVNLVVSETGNYYVSLKDANGCKDSSTHIQVNATGTTVMNTNNAGTNSLRRAIECAMPGDTVTIDFGLAGMIDLTESLLINKDLTIGNDAIVKSINVNFSGIPSGYGINIGAGTMVKLRNLNINQMGNTLNLPLIQTEGMLKIENVNTSSN